MNIKVSKYFLILNTASIIVFIFSLFSINRSSFDNVYISRVNDIFNKFKDIQYIFDSEVENYFSSNYINKYSIKEIRENLMDIKVMASSVLSDLRLGKYEQIGSRNYLMYILNDVSSVVDNDFIENHIFSANNETLIKNIQYIMDDIKIITNKYNLFKFNLGIYGDELRV